MDVRVRKGIAAAVYGDMDKFDLYYLTYNSKLYDNSNNYILYDIPYKQIGEGRE